MRNTRLIIGLALLFASILLAGLLASAGYNSFYWSNPGVFVPFTLFGLLAAFFGSFMVRKHLFPGEKRNKAFFDVLIVFGDVVLIFGLMATAGAFYSAIAIWANPMYWGKYYGTREAYNQMILATQMLFFWMSVAFLIAGQFIIGLGHKRER